MAWNVGLARSGTTMPMVSVLPSARLRPTGLGWYFSSAAAARTRAAISGSTVKLPFITRETVACETPAFSATSAMPILPVADFLAMGPPFVSPGPVHDPAPEGKHTALSETGFQFPGGLLRPNRAEPQPIRLRGRKRFL